MSTVSQCIYKPSVITILRQNKTRYVFNVLATIKPDMMYFFFLNFGTFPALCEPDFCRHPVERTPRIGSQPDADVSAVVCSGDATDSRRRADNTSIMRYIRRNTGANIRPSARVGRCLEPPAITRDFSPLRLS